MGDDNKIQLLPTELSEGSESVDLGMMTELNSTTRELPYGELDVILNVAEQFNKERQESDCYRIMGKIRPLITNVLPEPTGVDSLQALDVKIGNPTSGEDILYERQVLIRDIKGWMGHGTITADVDAEDDDIDPNCITYLNPKQGDLNILTTGGTVNWSLQLAYPATSTQVVNNLDLTNGIDIVDKREIIVNGKSNTLMVSKLPHNLKIRDSIQIFGSGHGVYDDDRVLVSGINAKISGLTNEHTFILDIPYVGANTLGITFKKVIFDTECEYHVRNFKVIADQTSFDVFANSFNRSYYSDNMVSFGTRTDIDTSLYRDYLGRPLTELKLVLVKRAGHLPYKFTDVKAGFRDVFKEMYPKVGTVTKFGLDVGFSQIYEGIRELNEYNNFEVEIASTGVTGNLGLIKNVGDEYVGDVVEYNRVSLTEDVITEVYHRFNTVNRSESTYRGTTPDLFNDDGSIVYELNTPVENSVPKLSELTGLNIHRREGYFYKPFHTIKIREFSTFVESGDLNSEGIPDYAEYRPNGDILWRDLLEKGFIEGNNGVDYPFLNNCTYVYDNFNFALKRQERFIHPDDFEPAKCDFEDIETEDFDDC